MPLELSTYAAGTIANPRSLRAQLGVGHHVFDVAQPVGPVEEVVSRERGKCPGSGFAVGDITAAGDSAPIVSRALPAIWLESAARRAVGLVVRRLAVLTVIFAAARLRTASPPALAGSSDTSGLAATSLIARLLFSWLCFAGPLASRLLTLSLLSILFGAWLLSRLILTALLCTRLLSTTLPPGRLPIATSLRLLRLLALCALRLLALASLPRPRLPLSGARYPFFGLAIAVRSALLSAARLFGGVPRNLLFELARQVA